MPITPLDNAGAYADVQGNRHNTPPRAPATITPIGGNQDVTLMRGMEAFVHSTEAVEQELSNTASTLRIISERTQRMYGQAGSTLGNVTGFAPAQDPAATALAVREGIEEAMTSVLARFQPPPPTQDFGGGAAVPIGGMVGPMAAGGAVALRGEEYIAPGSVRAESLLHPYRQEESEIGENDHRRGRGLIEPMVRRRQSGGRSLPYQTSPATRGDVETVEEIRGDTPEGPSNYERYQAGREYDVRRLRQDVFRSVGKRLSQYGGYGDKLEQQWVPLPEGEQGPPTPAWFHTMPEGMAGPPAPAAELAVGSFARREAVASTARNIGGSLVEGEGAGSAIMSVLPAGVGAAAGGVTAAAMLVNQGLNYATNQRAENARWQEIMGGSNAEGFGQRARAQAFEWGMKGTMGAGQAGQLYFGTAETGLRGGQRTDAIDFAVDAYRRFGMGVQDSMKLIQVAAETGQTSFKRLTTALEDVTKAARDAGVNTRQARSIFTQQYAQLATEVGPQAAPVMAASLTAAQVGLGREYQNVNFGGMMTPEMLRIGAAQQGLTLGQLQSRVNQPGGAGFGMAASQNVINNVANQMMGRGGLSAIQSYTAANRPMGERGDYSQGQYEEMVRALQESAPNLDPQVVAQVLGQFGIQGLDLNNAVPMLAHIASGGWNPARQAQDEANRQIAGGRTRSLGAPGSRPLGALRTAFNNGTGAFNAAQGAQIAQLLGIDPRRPGEHDEAFLERINQAQQGPMVGDQTLRDVYLGGALKTGRAGGISDLLTKNKGDAATGAGISKVKVKTAQGDRIVSLGEAIKHYRDQIDRGDAEVMTGNKAGTTVAEALNVKGDEGVKVSSATDKDLTKKGTSAEDWEKKHPMSHVLVSPTPELARILKFGGLNVSQGQDPLTPPPAQQQPWDRQPG